MASASSAHKAFVIAPGPGLLAVRPKRLYVGTGGDVSVILSHDDPTDTGSADIVIFKNVPAGSFLDITVKRVLAATTASNILGLV